MRLPLSPLLILCLAGGLAAQSGRSVKLTSAPAINRMLNITVEAPVASAGNTYVMLWSMHTNAVTPPPHPFIGNLLLDVPSLGVFYQGVLSATGDHTVSVLVPNRPALVGQSLDLQSAELSTSPTTTVVLSDNDVVVTVTNGVGTSVFAEGTTATTVGRDLVRVQNPSMGNPTIQNGTFRYNPQIIQVIDIEGRVQGYTATFGGTPNHVDIGILKGDRVGRDMRQTGFQSIALPNGKNFAVVRDVSTPGEFLAVTIDQTTGVVTELTGSRMLTATTTTTPANAYANLWGFSPDGSIAVGMVDRGLNTNVPPAPDDTIVLIRTDGTNWPTSGTSTLDISSVPSVGTQWFDRNVIIANETVFVRGSTGTWWAPLDGSAPLALVNLPNTGTNQPNAWVFSGSWVASRDGRTLVFPIGGSPTLSTTEHDLVSITGIDRTGTFTVRNITAFPTITTLQRFFGSSRNTSTFIKAALSADGSVVAFFGGTAALATPDQLYLARTDGSQAGTLVPVAGFPLTNIIMGTPHFLPNGSLTVFSGTASTALDIFHYDPAAAVPTVTNLSNVGNMNVPWTLISDNRQYLYFARGYTSTALSFARNLVAVTPAGTLRDITGSEFSSGTAPSLELNATVVTNEFRLAPNASGEIYFAAPTLRVGTDWADHNIFKFNFETGSQAVQLTNNSGTGTSLVVQTIDNLNVIADGTLAWSQGQGSQSSLRPRSVFTQSGAPATKILLNEFASGWSVPVGMLRMIDSPIRAAVWVQANSTLGATAPIGYFAHLDGTMKGHPLVLAVSTQILSLVTTGTQNP